MTTTAKPQVRNVLATPAGQSGGQWVCQPLALGTDDRSCGVCRSSVMICSGLYLLVGIPALLPASLPHFRWYKNPRSGHFRAD
jgi:hypothetical protein